MKTPEEIHEAPTTIAAQDRAMPPCPRGKCSVCQGSPLQHHWGIDSTDGEEPTLFLQCRHCDAQITQFDSRDLDCPEA